jgi:hypothetical protein
MWRNIRDDLKSSSLKELLAPMRQDTSLVDPCLDQSFVVPEKTC